MKKSIKKLWVTALRSGEYEQTDGQLRLTEETGTTSFCCLGVLCNLHAQAHPKIAAMNEDSEMYMGEEQTLPAEVMKWAGLNEVLGDTVIIGGRANKLAEHNDGGSSFAEIANAIEAQL